MMGVFIKGMEMPKHGDVLVVREYNGKTYIKHEGHVGFEGRIIEVKEPHGRLKDVDRIEYENVYFEDVGNGIDVYYERIKGGFRFYVYVDSDETALEIVKAIAEQMIFDHDESQHGVSWRTVSMEVITDEWGFRRIVDWKYRVRDSY